MQHEGHGLALIQRIDTRTARPGEAESFPDAWSGEDPPPPIGSPTGWGESVDLLGARLGPGRAPGPEPAPDPGPDALAESGPGPQTEPDPAAGSEPAGTPLGYAASVELTSARLLRTGAGRRSFAPGCAAPRTAATGARSSCGRSARRCAAATGSR
ncbi:hypothetical protein [Streptacidiphilus sp. PB12-B1b]|uniref:hypothetical protein n=1 Tax=Streptacidiphilus sp. PB12-B1b TaxID=2705012 RepID=UPI001CDB7A48|nr:hypothetical protein [Streptacidiphilus sp. PB12-B1b]